MERVRDFTVSPLQIISMPEQQKKKRWFEQWSLATIIASTLFTLWIIILIPSLIGLSYVFIKEGGLGGIAIFIIWPLALLVLPLWWLLLYKLYQHSIIASGISIFVQPFLTLLLFSLLFSWLPQSLYVTIYDVIKALFISVITGSVLYLFIREFKQNRKLVKEKTGD